VKLSAHYSEGGGAFTFLREINAEGLAGSLSRVLIALSGRPVLLRHVKTENRHS